MQKDNVVGGQETKTRESWTLAHSEVVPGPDPRVVGETAHQDVKSLWVQFQQAVSFSTLPDLEVLKSFPASFDFLQDDMSPLDNVDGSHAGQKPQQDVGEQKTKMEE